MSDFVGRRGYMATLEVELDRVRQTGRGSLVSMRGRRRVGKSRLVGEFLRRDAHPPVPYVFFTASRQPLARELELFAQDVARSELSAGDVVRSGGVAFESWDGALTFLATTVGGTPQVIVIDEFPYLVEQDPSLEATLQKVWDRYLREAPRDVVGKRASPLLEYQTRPEIAHPMAAAGPGRTEKFSSARVLETRCDLLRKSPLR